MMYNERCDYSLTAGLAFGINSIHCFYHFHVVDFRLTSLINYNFFSRMFELPALLNSSTTPSAMFRTGFITPKEVD